MQQGTQAPPGPATLAQQRIQGHNFVIKQKKLSLGNKYFLENATGQPIGFCHQKLLKLKEDIRIYTDENMNTEMLKIKQEQIIDFSGSYQVTDSQSGELIGILKRKGLKSMVKDEWYVLDRDRNEIGLIKERGGIGWFIRHFIFKALPYEYDILLRGTPVGTVTEKFQIIGDTYYLDLNKDPGYTLDRRLAMAAGLMMDIGEHE
ncbi:MAG: hypothetical protein KAJ51_06890 [Thermoplasmata archaeon]|nr:hypothetical protein [Thermoplasmata archaeon]